MEGCGCQRTTDRGTWWTSAERSPSRLDPPLPRSANRAFLLKYVTTLSL